MKLLIFFFPLWLVFANPVEIQVESNVRLKTIETEDEKHVIQMDIWDSYNTNEQWFHSPVDTLEQESIQFKVVEIE